MLPVCNNNITIILDNKYKSTNLRENAAKMMHNEKYTSTGFVSPTFFSEPLAHGELLWSLVVRRQSCVVNNCLKDISS